MFHMNRLWLVCTVLLVSSVGVAIGQGTSNPFAPVVNFTGTYAAPLPTTTVDFDLDGWPDVIVNGIGTIRIFFGLPGGGFSTTSQALIGTGSPVLVQAVEDMNFDGYPDVITAGPGTMNPVDFKIYHNNRVRGVMPPVNLSIEPSVVMQPWHRLKVIQPPGNPAPTIIVISRNTAATALTRYWLSSMTYDGTAGTWTPQFLGQLPVVPPVVFVMPTHYIFSDYEDSGPQGDFNGDGITDWLMTAFISSAAPNSAPIFSHWVLVPGLSQAPWFDLQNVTEIRIPRPSLPPGVISTTVQRSEVYDMNGDGMTDLVALFIEWYSSSSVPFTFNADSLFVTFGSATVSMGSSWVQSPRGLGILSDFPFQDYDGDGLLDIASLEGPYPASSPFEHLLLLARGYRDGSFSPFMVQEVPRGRVFRFGFPADLDGDGDLDILDNSVPFNPPRPATAFFNESILGFGYPAVNGVTPRIRRSSARLGDPTFGVAVDLAPRLSPTVLAVSLGPATSTTPSPIGVDLDQLLWPLGAIGPTTTDFRGVAIQPLPLPPDPRLAGATLYFQWAVASPNSLGFCATPTAKIILWP